MLRLLLYLAALSQLPGATATSSTCTVTGPAVVDFGGTAGSVADHCAYTLVSGTGLKVIGAFQERRRTDVTFLDHMIVQVDGQSDNIHLKQGGIVLVGGTPLTLSSLPQTEHGVELSKDVNTVTAKVSLDSYTITVYFDGTTAHVHKTGTDSQQGLCVDSSSSQSGLKDAGSSSSSCGQSSTEAAQNQDHCPKMREHCNRLKEAPFSSCQSHVNPDAYIAACSDTLCGYPPQADGLQCQFLKAYVGACRLQSAETLDDWRSQAGCSAPQVSCEDTCADHEFCGEDIIRHPACLCRGHFAFKYRSTDTLSDPTVCEGNSASVSLPACLLREKGIDYSVLHLNDNTCKGVLDKNGQMVKFSFDRSKDCGTVISASDNKIIYENTIQVSGSAGTISRRGVVDLDFSCFYGQPDVAPKPFKIKGGAGLMQIESGSWNYKVKMGMFSDLACTQPIDVSAGLRTGTVIYMSLDTDGLDPDIITLVTKACWATASEDGSGVRYNLIENGCGNPDDRSMKVVQNEKGGSVVAFQMFQFKGNNDGISLSCSLKLCLRSDRKCMPRPAVDLQNDSSQSALQTLKRPDP